jgi:hypothetical protein
MGERIDAILAFHSTKSFGTKANLEGQEKRVADLYRSLETEEAAKLARLAIDRTDPRSSGESDAILRCLACLRSDSLIGHHEALVNHGVFSPPMLYRGAGNGIARRLLDLMPTDDSNHLLCALAWIGGEVVEEAFHQWREYPPTWVDRLPIPPHRYSLQAGWQLTPDARRRDLIVPICHPLLPPGGDRSQFGAVRVVQDHEGTCGWCGRTLTTLIDLDLASIEAPHLEPIHGCLRIATCEVCSCYGTVYTRVGPDGTSVWHESNRRPGYLPDSTAEWYKLPRGCLVLGTEALNWLESSDWLIPGIQFSQLGGHPTWIQDAEYPECPGCGSPMPFVAQLSNEDHEQYGEGIYYMFACGECGVAATEYQQS